MKTPEEIKNGQSLYTLEETKELLRVDGYIHSAKKLYRSALAYIQQLEAERERDGENIKKLCSYLAYGIPDAHVEENNCKECKRKCECRDCPDGTCFIICGKKEECKA